MLVVDDWFYMCRLMGKFMSGLIFVCGDELSWVDMCWKRCYEAGGEW